MYRIKKGEIIGLAATARFIEPQNLSYFINWLENKGLKIKPAKNLLTKFHQFAGNDNFRAECFQEFLEDDDLSAIWIVRGGYGTSRILNQLDWSKFQKNPKWIIGFSDITLLHLQLASLGIPSIHGEMPSRFGTVPIENYEKVLQILFNGNYHYQLPINSSEETKILGKIIGGNMSLFCHSIGNPKINLGENYLLFLEDLEEYYYHIDRMSIQMANHGIFNKCNGVLLGSFTDMKDNEIPFGLSIKEIFEEITNKPVYEGLPFGHSLENFAFIHGVNIQIEKSKNYLNIIQKIL